MIEHSGPVLRPSARRVDLAIAGIYLVLIALWSSVIPFNGAPDEKTHFFLLEYLAQFGTLPRPDIDPVTPFLGRFSGATYTKEEIWYHGLPFLHTLGAWIAGEIFVPLVPRGHQFLAPRAFNWLLGAIFAYTLIQLVRTSGATNLHSRLVAITFASIPQVTFVFSYFNHDAFGLTASSLALYAVLLFLRDPSKRAFQLALGIAVGLLFVSKPYHYPAIVFVGCLTMLALWGNRRLAPSIGRGLALAAVFTIVIAGPMLAMTFVAFGEVGGANMQEAFLAKHPEIASRNNGICYIDCPNALINFPATQLWIATTFQSFFAGLGWMNIWLPGEFYWGFFAPFTLVCFLMSALFTIVPSDRDAPHLLPYFGRAFVALTWLMLLGTMLMSLLASQTIAPQAQGRYLFVVLPFVACSVGLVLANLQFALPASR